MPSKKMKCIDCSKDCRPKVFTNEPRCRTCYNEVKNKKKIPRKDYARNWSLKKKYNISLEEFDLLWIVFKGRCGICNNELKLPLNKRGQPLDVVAVDHNHNLVKSLGMMIFM